MSVHSLKRDQAKQPPTTGLGLPHRTLPGLPGRVPFTPGQLILTPFEQTQMEAIGIDPAKGIPPGMAELIGKVQKEVAEDMEGAVPLPPDAPKLKVPPPIDIRKLPAEKQQELREFVEQYQTMAPKVAREAQQRAMLRPSVAAAVQKVQSLPSDEEGIEVVDTKRTLKKDPPKTELEAPPKVNTSIELPKDTPDDGALKTSARCQHCNWLLEQEEISNPSYEDKVTFLQAMRAGKPFTKAYDMYNGQVSVIYRALNSRHADLAMNQATIDLRDGRVLPQTDEFYKAWGDYRTLLAIKTIRQGGETIDVAGLVDGYISDPDKNQDLTPLPSLAIRLKEQTPLANESLWHIVNVRYLKSFAPLTEFLEARAQDSDFWQPIAVSR